MKITFEDEQAGLYQLNLWQSPHLWREILLDAQPNACCEAFQDDRGRRYWLEIDPSEAGVTLTIHRYGGKVARSVVTWAGPDEAVLEDLLVASPHRQRGLATRLLDRAVVSVRQYGARYLTGRVIRKDAERNPDLLDWYQRRGFAVQPVQAAPSSEPKRPMSIAAQRSQPHFETVATLRLDLEHWSHAG